MIYWIFFSPTDKFIEFLTDGMTELGVTASSWHTSEKCLPAFLSFVETWIETATWISIVLLCKITILTARQMRDRFDAMQLNAQCDEIRRFRTLLLMQTIYIFFWFYKIMILKNVIVYVDTEQNSSARLVEI